MAGGVRVDYLFPTLPCFHITPRTRLPLYGANAESPHLPACISAPGATGKYGDVTDVHLHLDPPRPLDTHGGKAGYRWLVLCERVELWSISWLRTWMYTGYIRGEWHGRRGRRWWRGRGREARAIRPPYCY